MTLTLYMEPLSPPCKAVIMTIEALQLSVEYITVNLTEKEHMKPDYLKKNPLHTIPTLVDGTTVICDSHAIMPYLVSKYGKDDSLYPKDLVKRAMVDQKLHFDTGYMFNHLRYFVKKCYQDRGREVEEHEKYFIAECYVWLDTFLGQTPYVAGDSLTIADFSVATSLTGLMILFPIADKTIPNVANWIKKMKELPYYEKHIEEERTGLIEFLSTISDIEAET